ncbi:hypothetical protein DOTSEDRAFT_75101 [Dothistroma septosporum NZE10]|uniref:Uncharacterized protein n=1 Tax=Dothistroma septosporum (strain NZE10 / CBS 128990) TaxID=675120 RepID=M2XIH0_DOTSN|nr:hypothetical protein DOTSEDRAFT_75101 [Dothistroma septosporum NZE10]
MAWLPCDTRRSTEPIISKRKAPEAESEVTLAKRMKSEEASLSRVDSILRASKPDPAAQDTSTSNGVSETYPALEEVSYSYEFVPGKICRYLCKYIHDRRTRVDRYLVVTPASSGKQVAGVFCKLTTTYELRARVKRALRSEESLGLYHRRKLIDNLEVWRRLDTFKIEGNEDFTVASVKVVVARRWSDGSFGAR